MILRRSLLSAAMAGVMFAFVPGVQAADKPNVVATFSILGDMVREIGGDRVQVTTLVGANGDAHVYQPTPAAARAVGSADLVIVNGLGFEGWLDRLVTAAGYKGPVTVATTGISAIKSEEDEHHERGEKHGKEDKHHDHHGEKDEHAHGKEKHKDGDHNDHHRGEFDPHAWHSLANARIYVRNITDALIAADPAGAATFKARAGKYLDQMNKIESEIKAAVAALPQARRKVITPHDAFGYFAHEYGITFLAPQGMSTESEASAGDVAKLIRQIKAEHIAAVFVENVTDQRLLDQIARETGAKLGGTLYSDALSDSAGPADTYLNMMRHNYKTLVKSLGTS